MSTDTLKISNGPWDAGTAIVNAVTGEGENFSDGDIWIFPTDDAGPVAICHKPGDAILIADAGTTFNRTGKTPSQLAERLEEAEKLLRETQGIVQMLMDILRELPDDTDYEGMEVERPLPLAKASMKRVRAFLTRTTNG